MIVLESALKPDLASEEDNTLVTQGTLETILETYSELLAEQNLKTLNTGLESLTAIISAVADRINKERYERLRFEHFVIDLICSTNYFSRELVQKKYKLYCEEFDRLNNKETSSTSDSKPSSNERKESD